MCDPTGISFTIAAMAMSMAAQYAQSKQQAKAQKASAEYNAQVAANEAATQQHLAQNEIAKGAAEKSRQQRAAVRAMGEMRANMGASGFELDSGSMLSMLEESAGEHQYDSQIIGQNAAQSAWQHQVAATGAQNNRNYANWQSANANSGALGTYLGMGGTLMGGLGKAVGQYNDWQLTKTPKGS